MIIGFELQGSKMLHKGIFDTTGFWVKYGEDVDDVTRKVTCYKLWSHFSFTFESTEKNTTIDVLDSLEEVLNGEREFSHIPDIGFIELISS